MGDRSALVRARIAGAVMFACYGIVLGTWTARIPAIKSGLQLGDGMLGVALLGFAVGAITGMQGIGRLVDRYGGGRIMAVAAVADGVLLVTPALAGNLAVLVGCLLAFGVAHGSLNIAMNAYAVQVERAWAASIMTSFHAVYSIGGFLGAALGGVAAQAGLAPAATFGIVTVLVGVLAAVATRLQPADTLPVPAAPERPRPTKAASGVFFLGVLAFCCLVGEGAAADWSTVYVRDRLGSGAGFAAAAYAAFAVMMTVGRLVGDRLATRLGPVTLVRRCGVLAAVGLGAALLVNRPVAGVLGFGVFGAGLSCIAPLVFSAAGNRDPDRAGQAIARVASLGWAGFLVGPIVIGGVAQLIGLAAALAIPVVLALFVASSAIALRPAGSVAR
jgi:MFS family permease